MNGSEPICSFCGQPESRVEKVIAGNGEARICNRCVALGYDVLSKEGVDMRSWRGAEPPFNPGK